MRSKTAGAFFLSLGLLAVSGTAALADRLPGSNTLESPLRYPNAPKPYYDEQKPAYAMNYSEEVAQTLGVRDGHMDVFSSTAAPDSLIPSVSGGVGGGGAMFRLQWHPEL